MVKAMDVKHGRRNYGQYCGLAGALDIVGERWTLLIVRELLVGPCRYTQLLANLPGIGTNLLADRLKFLTDNDVIMARPSRQGSKMQVYELTPRGEGLREPVLALARWGLGSLQASEAEYVVRSRWAVIAVEALVDQHTEGPDERYEFRIDDEVFHVDIAEGRVSVVHGAPAGNPVLVVCTDAKTFIDIGAGRIDPLGAVISRRVVMEGPTDAIVRCSRLLGLIVG